MRVQVSDAFGWRYALFGEAILMLPFAILAFVMKPLQMKGICQIIWCWLLISSFMLHPYQSKLLKTTYLQLSSVACQFKIAGFSPAGSKSSVKTPETTVIEVEGTPAHYSIQNKAIHDPLQLNSVTRLATYFKLLRKCLIVVLVDINLSLIVIFFSQIICQLRSVNHPASSQRSTLH